MIFTATRFENGVEIRCEADNIVMRDDLEKPLHDTHLLEVMCKKTNYYFLTNAIQIIIQLPSFFLYNILYLIGPVINNMSIITK